MPDTRLFFCLALGLLLVSGCASRQPAEPPAPAAAAGEWPQWYQVYDADEAVFFGFGEGHSSQLNLAMQQARLAARAELAEQFNVHIQGLAQQGAQQTFDDPAARGMFETAQRALVERSLAGSQPDRVHRQREADGSVRVFVRMSATRDEADRAGRSTLARMDELLDQQQGRR